ncbi:pyridoxamine 5'-phosphate oxidase family protein [Streptomyces sp. TLI_185]|uniref:pyridoxamine 5'-phosphate oxidase family protein n=1 Tax=Streptomyces sp. TLI_185 TaxID=2485151 RepID=UPI000F4E5746|nr:pyridoxamine 5'-phosphate oxidase family protein [Streptomyces sp. TLI_185]
MFCQHLGKDHHSETIVIRTHDGSALLHNTSIDQVVVYDAGQIDPRTRTGWSVMVTGPATPITDPAQAARYRRLLVPWIECDNRASWTALWRKNTFELPRGPGFMHGGRCTHPIETPVRPVPLKIGTTTAEHSDKALPGIHRGLRPLQSSDDPDRGCPGCAVPG